MSAASVPHSLRLVVDAISDAAALVSPKGRLLYWNPAYLQLLGKKPRHLRGGALERPCEAALDLEICSAETCPVIQALSSRMPVRLHAINSSRRDLTVNISAVPLHAEGEDDTPWAVLELIRDVTAESRMQASYRGLLERERRQRDVLKLQLSQLRGELAKARQG